MTSCWLDQLGKTVWKGLTFSFLFYGRQDTMSLGKKKAKIFQNTVKYLGFHLFQRQHRLSPERKQAVCSIPASKTHQQFRVFLAAAGFCLAGGQPPHGDQGLSTRFSTPPPPSFHGYHGNSHTWQLRNFPFHPLPSLSPLITMATPAGRQWVLTYPTDPYYPELLPTKPRPIPTPHNTLSS
jgi:hypothetical protein